jgi:hypothetical protein
MENMNGSTREAKAMLVPSTFTVDGDTSHGEFCFSGERDCDREECHEHEFDFVQTQVQKIKVGDWVASNITHWQIRQVTASNAPDYIADTGDSRERWSLEFAHAYTNNNRVDGCDMPVGSQIVRIKNSKRTSRRGW